MSIICDKWWGGWSEIEKTETTMKYLFDELSENESSFQDYHSPFADYEKLYLHEGSNGPIRKTCFNSFMMSFKSNLMASVLASMQAGLENLLAQLTIKCSTIFNTLVPELQQKASSEHSNSKD